MEIKSNYEIGDIILDLELIGWTIRDICYNEKYGIYYNCIRDIGTYVEFKEIGEDDIKNYELKVIKNE